MKKIVLFIFIFLIVFSLIAESSFERWSRGIEEVVYETDRVYGGRIKLVTDNSVIEREYLWALVVVESNGDKDAKSKTNVRGITQLTLRVVNMIREETGVIIDREHPYEALWGAEWYLTHLKEVYGFSIEEALAAYYYGPSGLVNRLSDSKLNDLYHYRKIDYILRIIKK